MIDLRQNKAFALTFTLIFMFLIVSFMAVYILVIANGISEANRVANTKKAYYIADAGLADAYERITQAGINIIPTNNSYIPSVDTDNGAYSVGPITGNYKVSIVYSNSPRTNYTVTSTGTYGKVSKTLQLKIIGAAISKYAYWSQTENNPQFGQLWWVGIGDPNSPGSFVYLTTGPVQTNGTLNLFGNPIFYSDVTEANGDGPGNDTLHSPSQPSPNFYYGDLGTDPTNNLASDPAYIFPSGIKSDAPQVDLPPQPTIDAIKAVANDGAGLVLTGASTVIFNPTGTISVTGTVKDSTGKILTTYNNTTINAPANGVVFVQSNPGQTDGNVTVQGTVKGQLTVAADQNINISGSIAYNSDPRIIPTSTDMVGLVANQNITVIESSAPNFLEMSAVLVALQGSFQVDQWWVYRGPASGPGSAVMDQFGSLINYVCGVTGEMDMSGDLLGGWNQLQSFDNRLSILAPPGFPPYVNNSGNGVYNKISVLEL